MTLYPDKVAELGSNYMIKNMKFRLLFAFLCINAVVFAQNNLFHKGDRVCFVGNSITSNGEFYHNIMLYYVTRFPNQPITVFNCGISGDVCSGVLKRIDEDVLSHNPTHAVIMLGMNDVMRGLYSINPIANADTLAKREEAIATYKVLLDSIINIFLSKGIKVILQKPTIYDQTAAIKRENNFGVNDALKRCADHIQSLADKYKLLVVDYWTMLNQINTNIQKRDSTATIIGPDRVHPGSAGHLIMAYQFLKTTKAPRYISEIVVNENARHSIWRRVNCQVTEYTNLRDIISFKVKEKALPFPTSEGQKQALQLIPFVNDLSEEMLVVKNGKGTYQLMIDTTLIGTLSAEELAKGINLSLYTNTPQFQQALKVKDALNKMWKAVSDLRTIEYVEFKFLSYYKGNKENMAVVKDYLDNLYKTKLTGTPYYKTQFDRYYIVKANQQQLLQDFDTYREEAYKLAQPVEHNFIIKSVN